ncbi:3-isopropylmalate dehydratase small subunit [Maribacter algarum]|uniref:3-isopropylmalate dehydratase small subunit n=1 Tax=Maribacter algarum (ex Zhang et al. 2020) TaxID=2578118 RepID=A0A5S3PUF8_9FLAO|nr:3-isopropylmalate dehydratase small subunit [Maribacter algarum]TMM58649.1 3-isopropylmalate dehydratase small subunit [Maribacter algarum]
MSEVQTNIKAKAHVYGDHIDTDRIIPGKYTKTLDMTTLANHVLEDLDPNFNKIVQQGDILVAGINFGCGSSREQAPLALKKSGVSVVVAKDFARIFFRNAINIGLPVLEIADHNIQKGAELDIDLKEGNVKDLTAGVTYTATKLPDIMINILAEGGLVNYLTKYGDYSL